MCPGDSMIYQVVGMGPRTWFRNRLPYMPMTSLDCLVVYSLPRRAPDGISPGTMPWPANQRCGIRERPSFMGGALTCQHVFQTCGTTRFATRWPGAVGRSLVPRAPWPHRRSWC
jgi:hypothetical protein